MPAYYHADIETYSKLLLLLFLFDFDFDFAEERRNYETCIVRRKRKGKRNEFFIGRN